MGIAKILTNSSGDVASPGATINVTKPTGGTPGASDILVLCVGSGAGATVGSWTAPAGWTLIGQLLDQVNVADHVSQQVWWAAGNVANLTFTKVGFVASLGWIMVCFSGCNSVTPVDATGTPNSRVTDGSTLVTNAVTIATDQAWHAIGFGSWLGGTNSAPSFTAAQNSPATNEDSTLLYNTTPKSVGSTGTVTVTSSAGTSGQVLVGIPFALRPAARAGMIPNYRDFPKVALQYPKPFRRELINSQLR